MPSDTRAAFLRALDPHVSQMEQAFIEAFLDIRSSAVQSTVEEIIQRYEQTGDIQAAMRDMEAAIRFASRGFFAPLDQALDDSFMAGALYQTDLVPKRHPGTGARLVVRFDQRHERAEQFLRRAAGDLVTEIAEDTRAMVRETITEGVEDGRAYRRIARDLIGTTRGNQRKGGVLGLHSRQAQAVRAARRELETGDYGAYLSRSPETRDRRFDRTIAKSQREGVALTKDQVDTITGRYADGLLQYRGRLVARTEVNKAGQAGRTEAVEQMIENGTIPEKHVTKRWVATVGQHTREAHVELNGTEVGWREKFISPATGFPMDHPHDEGAPAEDVVACRCVMLTRPDWIAAQREQEGR